MHHSGPGQTFRIGDWDNPRLPALVRMVDALPPGVAERLLSLDEADLLRSARWRTGLADFGGEAFREPLRLMLGDLAADDRLTPFGRIVVRSVLTQLLATRLCIEHEIAVAQTVPRAPIPAPIVIVGLPRTGTTHLHNLLAQVPALRTLPLWESVAPFRPPGWRSQLPDLRRLRNRLRLMALDRLMPLLRVMHEMEVDLPHEELQLCAPEFRSFFFEASFRLPRYRAWYAGRAHPQAYAYLRRVLELLPRRSPEQRWVLKSPQHLDQLDALTATFPDAKIVRTHREPARAALSLITMILYVRRSCYRGNDVAAEARQWVDRLEQMLRASLAQAERLPAANVIDVEFDGFMADPVGTAARVLEFAGIEVDAPARAALEVYQRSHARNRHGRVEYDAASLGLDLDEMRQRFRFYAERSTGGGDKSARSFHRERACSGGAGASAGTD